MGFRLIEMSPVKSKAHLPLAGNTNHLGTQFGGSLFSAGALSCYSSLLGILLEGGISLDQALNIVITESSIRYLAPGSGDLDFHVEIEVGLRQQFMQELLAKKRARIDFRAQAFLKQGPLQASYRVKL